MKENSNSEYVKVAIAGSKVYGEKIISLLEGLGGNNFWEKEATSKDMYYFVGDGGDIESSDKIPDGYFLLKTKDNENAPEQKNFPRTMFVWNSDIERADLKVVHGYIPTIKYPWITANNMEYQNASDTDPRIPELTIEEAELKYKIKIKRK